MALLRPGHVLAVAVVAVTAIACNGSPSGWPAGFGGQVPIRGSQVGRGQSAPAPGAPSVGALFVHDLNGGHFCTASVIDSPHRNLIVTAAHCIDNGDGSAERADLAFVPGYRSGTAPYGVWNVAAVTIDPRWTSSADPDLDVAFLALAPTGGRNIGDVVPGNRLATNTGEPERVEVTGYPNASDVPITCANATTAHSPTQLRIVCTDFSAGTSGSPWVTGTDQVGGVGLIVGVIGGYQRGGDVDDISYSPLFGGDIRALYEHAVAAA
jgi:V8-like Glu-specific endopeptidase